MRSMTRRCTVAERLRTSRQPAQHDVDADAHVGAKTIAGLSQKAPISALPAGVKPWLVPMTARTADSPQTAQVRGSVLRARESDQHIGAGCRRADRR